MSALVEITEDDGTYTAIDTETGAAGSGRTKAMALVALAAALGGVSLPPPRRRDGREGGAPNAERTDPDPFRRGWSHGGRHRGRDSMGPVGVVVDTNVLVSALGFGGTPLEALFRMFDGDIQLFASEPTNPSLQASRPVIRRTP